jgi:hypothetical protein
VYRDASAWPPRRPSGQADLLGHDLERREGEFLLHRGVRPAGTPEVGLRHGVNPFLRIPVGQDEVVDVFAGCPAHELVSEVPGQPVKTMEGQSQVPTEILAHR